MANFQLKKMHLIALLAGFTVIILVGIITNTISFSLDLNIIKKVGPRDFIDAFNQQPIIIFRWILGIISFLAPLIGGAVVGLIVKEKGWIYGGILGVMLVIIFIGFVILTFLLPTSLVYGPNLFSPEHEQELAQRNIKNIQNLLIYTPITIILTTVGGYLGEYYYKRNRKRNTA